MQGDSPIMIANKNGLTYAEFKAMNPKYDVIYDLSNDDPIAFDDSDSIRLGFAAIADTHLPDRESAEKNLENAFSDVLNSKEKTDALLLAGDIADYGLKKEYDRTYDRLFKRKEKGDNPMDCPPLSFYTLIDVLHSHFLDEIM